jgi:mevalonate kinase
MTQGREQLRKQSVDQIGDLVVRALRDLASRPDRRAFEELLRVNDEVGQCLGLSARTLAESGSWTQVADVAGTTKQAAWSRWRLP